MLLEFLQDGLFAALAAIGFAAISNPPRRAYFYCALLAAIGHSARFLLMQQTVLGLHIVIASTLAALLVGLLAVLLSPVAAMPAETSLFPSLLPMIPGVYAYKRCACTVAARASSTTIFICLPATASPAFSYSWGL